MFISNSLALITSNRHPSGGGRDSWIETALGTTVSAHSQYLAWVVNLLHSTVYAIFAGSYVVKFAGLPSSNMVYLAGGCAFLVSLLRLFSFDAATRFSKKRLVVFAVILPLLYILLAFPENLSRLISDLTYPYTCSIASLANHNGALICEYYEMQWTNTYSLAILMWSGFLSISPVLEKTQSSIVSTSVTALALISIVSIETLVPLALSLPIHDFISDYSVGYYVQLSDALAGKWFSKVITVTAIATLLRNCYKSSTSADEALTSFLARHFDLYFSRNAEPNPPKIVITLFEHGTGIAPIAVIFNTLIVMCMIKFPVQMILTLGMCALMAGVLIFLAAYVALKWKLPEAAWFYIRSPILALVLSAPTIYYSWVIAKEVFHEYLSNSGQSHFDPVPLVIIVLAGFIGHTLLHSLKQKSYPSASSRPGYRAVLGLLMCATFSFFYIFSTFTTRTVRG